MAKKYVPSMIFLRTAWMDYYQGDDSDRMVGAFSFLDKHPNEGHEKFNFKSFNGIVCGYAPVRDEEAINFKRINEDYEELDTYKNINGCDALSDITIIYFAHEPDPQGNAYIVGWYEHATIFEYLQEREVNGENYYYICNTNKENAYFIQPEKRDKVIPYSKDPGVKFGYGQSAKFYADQDDGKFRRDILKYIENFKEINRLDCNTEIIQYARDIEIKKAVEKNAIEAVKKYYIEKGYTVKSVEKENLGWDLEAIKYDTKLYLEVKGKADNNATVIITPNEYKNLKKFYYMYRICIVINALNKNSILTIFNIKKNDNGFFGEDINNKHNKIKIEEQIGAICRGVLTDSKLIEII